MADYLIHQTRDGNPVGVFTENDHYYFPSSVSHELYGISVVESKGTETTWNDWIDQLAGKSPGPHDQWDVYVHPIAPLYQVLIDARSDLQ